MDHQILVETMRAVSKLIPVLNSLLCISDPTRPRDPNELPRLDRERIVWATPACILVTCQPDCDGPTCVTLGPVEDMSVRGEQIFDGWLETPGRKVIVQTVLAEVVLDADVASEMTRVRIWTTGAVCSDFVAVGLG